MLLKFALITLLQASVHIKPFEFLDYPYFMNNVLGIGKENLTIRISTLFNDLDSIEYEALKGRIAECPFKMDWSDASCCTAKYFVDSVKNCWDGLGTGIAFNPGPYLEAHDLAITSCIYNQSINNNGTIKMYCSIWGNENKTATIVAEGMYYTAEDSLKIQSYLRNMKKDYSEKKKLAEGLVSTLNLIGENIDGTITPSALNDEMTMTEIERQFELLEDWIETLGKRISKACYYLMKKLHAMAPPEDEKLTRLYKHSRENLGLPPLNWLKPDQFLLIRNELLGITKNSDLYH